MLLWDDFEDIVERHFGFLTSEFGFRLVSSAVPFIVFESPFVRVNVFWEYGGRNELDLSIDPTEKIDKLGRSFGISEIIRLRTPDKPSTYVSPFPSTNEALEASVRELAELLLKYGAPVLRGDLRYLKDIQKLREEAERRYSRKGSV